MSKARLSLRRYDVQAVLGMITALASILPMLALAVFIFQQMDTESWVFYYGKNRQLAILGATAAALGLAAVGLGLGLNSAGQRRNDKPNASWVGLFVGAGVICVTLILFVLFMKRGESVLL